MSNLALRVLTAVVALALVAAVIARGEPLGFGVFMLVVAGLALTEYTHITLAKASPALRVAVIAVGVALAAALYMQPALAMVWALGALVAVSAAVLLDPGEVVGPGGAGARL